MRGEDAAALYPTISRLNHSCAPNVVWSEKKSNQRMKEVRVLRRFVATILAFYSFRHSLRIRAGEQICTNYIDDYEMSYSNAKTRQVSSSCYVLCEQLGAQARLAAGWGFHCGCQVCSLPPAQLEENDRLRGYSGYFSKAIS